MATRNDDIFVSVVCDVVVSEAAWRKWCAVQGVDLTGVVPAAHIAQTMRSLLDVGLTDIGFPQKAAVIAAHRPKPSARGTRSEA